MSVRRGLVVLAVLVPVAGCSYFGARHADDWRSRTDVDSAELAVNAALRNIDPCGFVDAESIKARIPRAISYGHTEGFDRCTLQLGGYDGDFVSDVSATIGFDLAPAPTQLPEPPVDSTEVNGIAVSHVLGPTSNRGWCRYVFNLDASDAPDVSSQGGAADLMKRVRLVVVASLARDPGPGRPVYPCKEAIAIATGAAQIRSRHLPVRSDSVVRPAAQDPCSLLADLRGFASYRPGNSGVLEKELYTCWFSAGPPEDRKAQGVGLTLRPVDPREPDTSEYGGERHSVVEQDDGVELHVSTVTRTYDKPFCEVYVFLGRNYSPTYLTPEGARPQDVRVPAAVLRGTSSCDDVKAVAVAAGKKFGQL
ncbi:hypothetical protein [Mycobacteroides salmoniphilum]|uniref:hypothetical protein n=1 Tax=Mycobacteroides salmoniphilum TaxID=404941 RepID=UPI001064DD39|nr:hypothetical protein [Mycobacteroides salmoniphilum]TDZ89778.1 hypothetical protein CCUG62472_04924 [Mycobacteroides salmoniphilum]